ncbi:HNH endonuclease [Rhodococcus sp. NPDC054953]
MEEIGGAADSEGSAVVVADTVVDQFARVVELLVARRVDEARAAVLTLDMDAIEAVRRSRLAAVAGRRLPAEAVRRNETARRSTERLKLAIFERDRWTCRFCGARTIDLRVMKRVSAAFPAELPYHPNWKFDASHRIYWTHTSSLEHVVPFARGGADDTGNFATTCYACNAARSHFLLEELGWSLRAPSESGWSGLTEHLGSLTASG